MHSVRRAVLRAASCSSRAIALPRQQVASFAVHVSKAHALPAATLPLSRYFSQTARAAQEQEEDAAAREEAVKSAEDDNSAVQDQESSSQADPMDATSVFVSNVSFDATELHLREAFSQYGEIKDIHIGRDSRGLSRGFAFITFDDKLTADKAVQQADKSFWHGRRINVQHRSGTTTKNNNQQRPGGAEATSSIYIGNIPFETSDADLNALFKGLNNVRDVRVAVDRNTGWPRGFAHADFADVESAQKAHDKLKEMSLGGRQLRVDFSEPRQTYNKRVGGGTQNRQFRQDGGSGRGERY